MALIKRTVSVPVFVLVGLLCAVIAYQAGATRVVIVNKPAVVATVNLPKVLEGLAQRSQADATLASMEADFRQEADRREKTVKQLETDLNNLRERLNTEQASSDVVQDLVDRINLEIISFQAWRQFKLDQFDVEQALLMQDIYRTIKRTIAEMAGTEGYDLVVFDTSTGELSINPSSRVSRTEQIQQQILARGVLYAGQPLDITNDLIERMNNQFRAGQQ
jgi:Skp family chaperone for outer membrane proteins